MSFNELMAAVIGKVVSALILVGAFLLALHFAPGLGTLLGEFESNWTAARKKAVAEHTEAIAEAEARPQRETFAAQRAMEIEADIAKRQVASVDNSHVAQRFGANVADIGCGLGLLSAALEPEKKTNDLLPLCGVSDQIRRGMSEDYAEAVNSQRTDVISETLDRFRQSQGSGD